MRATSSFAVPALNVDVSVLLQALGKAASDVKDARQAADRAREQATTAEAAVAKLRADNAEATKVLLSPSTYHVNSSMTSSFVCVCGRQEVQRLTAASTDAAASDAAMQRAAADNAALKSVSGARLPMLCAVKQSSTRSLTHSMAHSLTHSVTHPPTHSLTHLLTHSFTRSSGLTLASRVATGVRCSAEQGVWARGVAAG
jgi:hypothetical protein